MDRWAWIAALAAGAVAVTAGVAYASSPKAKGIRVALAPGQVRATGYQPGYGVTLVLPAGAKWGGVTDYPYPQPTGSQEFTFHEDDTKATSGVIGATWWDAHGIAQATTVSFGP